MPVEASCARGERSLLENQLKLFVPAQYTMCGSMFEICAAAFERKRDKTAMLMDTGANATAILPDYEHLMHHAYKSDTKIENFKGGATQVRYTGALGAHVDRCHSIGGLKFNVLGISQVCNPRTKYRFEVGDDEHAYIKRKSDGSVLIKGDLINGLWWCSLEDLMVPDTVMNNEGEFINYANARLVNKATRLHLATHMGLQELRASVEKGIIDLDYRISEEEWAEAGQFCNTCAAAKSKQRIPKMPSVNAATYIYEQLYIDLFSWKPIEKNGFKYAALLLDKFSRTRWLLGLKHKRDIYMELAKWFKSHIGIDCQKVHDIIIPKATPEVEKGIAIFQSDNAGELTSVRLTDLLYDYFVKNRRTIVAHMHFQDGCIERQIGLLCETARALQVQLHEPNRHDLYWHALVHSTWLSNRLNNPTGKSSYEHHYGKPPNPSRWIPYGCVGWAVLPHVYRYSKNPKIPELRRDQKSRPRAIPVKYLGHQYGKKGHKVLIKSNGRVAMFTTVYWDERAFGPCHIAGGLQVRKSRFRKGMRKLRKILRTSKDLPTLFEAKGDIEAWRTPQPPRPALGCSRCRFKSTGCRGKDGRGCQQKLKAWLEKYDKSAESGEESDGSLATLDSKDLSNADDSGSDLDAASEYSTDEELARTNAQTANYALIEKSNEISTLTEELEYYREHFDRWKRIRRRDDRDCPIDKIAALESAAHMTNGPTEKGIFNESYIDYLFRQDAHLPAFTGYRSEKADQYRNLPGVLDRDRCCVILNMKNEAMQQTQVIKIVDSVGHTYLLPIPSSEFHRVHMIKDGKESFSHFEYINTMMKTSFVPTTGAEAIKDPEWRKQGMFPEFAKLEEMKCWELVNEADMPEGAKLVSGKWVFRQKYSKDGQPTKKKGRYVCRGFSCRPGIDYSSHHTYSPVASADAIRLMLNICAAEGQILEQADITNAYIINELDAEIYMPLPEGYEEFCKSKGKKPPDRKSTRIKLLRSLYGMPQSGFLFYSSLVKALESLKFVQCTEPCVFYRPEDDGTVSRIAIYVDDLILGFSDQAVLDKFKTDLGNAHELFEVKQLGPLEFLLGVHVTYDRAKRTIALDQERYIEKLHARFITDPQSDAFKKRQLYPMKLETSMMFRDPAKWRHKYPKKEEADKPCDQTLYRAVIGSLLHAIKWTRNDAMTAVYFAATAMHRPTEEALQAALCIVRYLYDTKNMKLTYNLEGATKDLTGYCDSDLGGWHDGRSRGGWSIKVGTHAHNNPPFVWNCHLERVIFRSIADSEQSACARLGCDLVVYRRLATQLGFRVDDKLTNVYSDNNPLIKRIDNPIRVRCKLHSKLRLMKVIEFANRDSTERIMIVHHIDGPKNPSDIWTKIQPNPKDFLFCRKVNMNLPQ